MKDKTPERLVRVGRPTKLTDEMIVQLEELLAVCQYIDSVCHMVGIDQKTLWNWVQRGRKECLRMAQADTDLCAESKVVFVRLFQSYKKALARGEITDCNTILNASRNGIWQASAWRLERRFPQKYGNQNREIKALEKELNELRQFIGTIKDQHQRIAELEKELAKYKDIYGQTM